MVLAVVLVCVGMAVVVVRVVCTKAFVLVSCEIIVAAPGCLVVTGIAFRILSNKFGEARSHFTRKCKIKVDHEATTVSELLSRFLYQSPASESDLQ